MEFWALAGVIGLLALTPMVWPLLKPRKITAVRSSYDVQVYKDQLKEVEADLARGVLSEPEAKASRTEVSRRLLAAADAEARETTNANAPQNLSRILAVIVAAVVIGGGVTLYRDMGVPGLRDLPLEVRASLRPSQEEAEKAVAQDGDNLPDVAPADPKHLELITQLQDVLKDRPNDLVGHQMLADNLAQLGQYPEARVAQETVMRILGDEAKASDFASLAEILIIAANYYVSPTAEGALATALDLDPTQQRARYYAGILMLQRQDYTTAYNLWAQLLAEGPADAPWIPIIQGEIEQIAIEAGIDMRAGPTANDMAAASELTAEERDDLVRSMVGRLSERLADEGGSAQEWAQLIGAYGVLGETGNASAIWNEAQEVFADDPAALQLLLDAARNAEVSSR